MSAVMSSDSHTVQPDVMWDFMRSINQEVQHDGQEHHCCSGTSLLLAWP